MAVKAGNCYGTIRGRNTALVPYQSSLSRCHRNDTREVSSVTNWYDETNLNQGWRDRIIDSFLSLLRGLWVISSFAQVDQSAESRDLKSL